MSVISLGKQPRQENENNICKFVTFVSREWPGEAIRTDFKTNIVD